jgi:hypothetical protein
MHGYFSNEQLTYRDDVYGRVDPDENKCDVAEDGHGAARVYHLVPPAPATLAFSGDLGQKRYFMIHSALRISDYRVPQQKLNMTLTVK